MDLALSSVDELYVGDEKLIAAVNTWTESLEQKQAGDQG